MLWLFLIVGFIVIALIVSFDVVGLTISKSKYYADNPQRLLSWACLNGFWHAVLLLTYGLFISGLIKFFEFNLDFLLEYFVGFETVPVLRRIPEVAQFLQEHLPVIAGIIALIVIWQTYQDKITDEPTNAARNNLGRLAKYLFDIFELIIRFFCGDRVPQSRIREILRSNIEAALVAVDMLALAILANQLGMMDTVPKVFGFSTIVFLIVTPLCFFAGKWGVRYFAPNAQKAKFRVRQNPDNGTEDYLVDPSFLAKQWWLVTLRLMEPWLIFYFALELLSVLLFGEQTHSPGYIFGTSLMLYAVVRSVGLEKVVCAAVADHAANQTPSGVREAGRSILTIIGGLAVVTVGFPLLFFLSVIVASIAIGVSWEAYVALYDEKRPAFDAMLFFTGSFATVLVFFVQFGSDVAKEIVAKAFDWLEDHYYAFIFSVSAVAIAVIVPVFHDLKEATLENDGLKIFSDDFWNIVVLDMHVHATQVVLSLLWVLLLSLIIPWLRPRRIAGLEEGRKVDITWRDLVMVHGQRGAIVVPLVLVGLSMLLMIELNQSIYDFYCFDLTNIQSAAARCAT